LLHFAILILHFKIMKVLIFSTAYFPYVGGAEVAVKEITDRIANTEFEMIAVRLRKSDAKKEEKQIGKIKKIYRLGFGLGRIDKFLFPFRAARLANKLHKQNHYDIAWSIMASFSGFAALFFKKKNPEVKFLLTLQEGDDLKKIERKVWLVKPWFKQIFARADYIQAISNYLADWAKKMGATCLIEIIPNGAKFYLKEDNDYKKEKKENYISYNPKGWFDKLGEIVKKDNVKKRDKIIITVSRLVEKNGIEYLIKAMKELPENYKLRIVGDGKLSEELKQLTKELKLTKRVQFHGKIKNEDIRYYYEATAEKENDKFYVYSVFVRPSLSEGLGNSFLEAMSLSVPVVATPVGGIPDFLQDGETGWFCEAKNPQSIAEKIKYVLDDKNKTEVQRVVENAKKMVSEKYNWNKIAVQMNNIFNKLSS